jgi:putative flippase GtrA
MIKKLLNKEFIMYAFFGVFTTLVNIVAFWLFTRCIVLLPNEDLNIIFANVIAWILSVIFAFVTNKIWVFESKAMGKELIKEAVAFFSCRGASLLMDIAVVFVGFTVLGFPDMPVKIFSNVLVVIFNYIFSKLFIFRNGGVKNETN